MKLLIACVVAVCVSSSLSAQVLPAPLKVETFEAFDLVPLPSLRMSPGWSACITLVAGEDRLMRVWYRQSDGLVVATLHDTSGHVLTQTQRGWTIGRNLEQFSAVLSTMVDRASPPTGAARTIEVWHTRVTLSAYDPFTGEFIEGLFTWSARVR